MPRNAVMQVPSFSLAGDWQVALDPESLAEAQHWFTSDFPATISLPGTLDEAGIGFPNPERASSHLSRRVTYTGAAWYSRQIEIPPEWADLTAEISFERCLWKTRCWIDGEEIGTQNSLVAPHLFEFAATPGTHRLTVCVDNSRQLNLGGHAYSVGMQTIWNGILGAMTLRVRPTLFLDDAQVFPAGARGIAVVQLSIGNSSEAEVAGDLTLLARYKGDEESYARASFKAKPGFTELQLELDLGSPPHFWDEFSPALYDLQIDLETAVGRDGRTLRFGVREFATRGTQFTINGRATFLRGEHDAGADALRGYPPLDKTRWERIFGILRDWGINHVRFHSWCPAQAAFEVADELGLYLQVELPLNGVVPAESEAQQFLLAEMRRIVRHYGNHPSFVLFSNGNELRGDATLLREWVRIGQQLDNRRLWTLGSNAPWEYPALPGPGDPEEFFVGTMVKEFDQTGVNQKGFLRGSYHMASLGHVNNTNPSTDTDYSEAVQACPVPALSHEVGQYSVYPNYEEIAKFTGVLEARNFEIFRESLEAHGMPHQASDFVRASGALQWRLYKEEVEAALRTPGMGGFQLLDLRDNQDQGSAICGLLDVFWDNKGFLTPQEWRQFCSPTVPLLRLEKLTWTSDEIIEVRAQVAHYGAHDMEATAFGWELRDAAGQRVASGALLTPRIGTGNVRELGHFSLELTELEAPGRFRLSLFIPHSETSNFCDFWVYPAQIEVAVPDKVTIAHLWSQARHALEQGESVLLLVSPQNPPLGIAGCFQTDFWCYPMFKNFDPPGTLGLLCDLQHPALSQFPTDGYSDWQWFDLLHHSRSLILDELPPGFTPILQIIDNLSRNHKLGNLFEAKVGEGRLLVCSIDLENDLKNRVVARQLRRSLLDYIASPAFEPGEVSLESFDQFFGVRVQNEADQKALFRVCGTEIRTPHRAFSVRYSDENKVIATCPPGFNGRLRVLISGEGRASIYFQNRLEIELEASQGANWVEISTAQKAWTGTLDLQIVPKANVTMLIVEWAIFD